MFPKGLKKRSKKQERVDFCSQVGVDCRLEQQARHSEHERPERQDAPADQQHILQRVAAADAVGLTAARHLQGLVAVHHVDLRQRRRPEGASILGAAGRDHLRDGVLALVELGYLVRRVGVHVGLRHGHSYSGSVGAGLGFFGHCAEVRGGCAERCKKKGVGVCVRWSGGGEKL